MVFKVASYTDRRFVEKPTYEYFRLVNSYEFIASSLEKFVSSLTAENFSLLVNYFPQPCSDDLRPLHWNGFYP